MTEPTPELLVACDQFAKDWVYSVNAWYGRSPEYMQTQKNRLRDKLVNLFQAREQAARTEGFELAHESFSCGHARANYRDKNYRSTDSECDSSKCEFCEAENRWKAREKAARIEEARLAYYEWKASHGDFGNRQARRIAALLEPKEPRG